MPPYLAEDTWAFPIFQANVKQRRAREKKSAHWTRKIGFSMAINFTMEKYEHAIKMRFDLVIKQHRCCIAEQSTSKRASSLMYLINWPINVIFQMKMYCRHTHECTGINQPMLADFQHEIYQTAKIIYQPDEIGMLLINWAHAAVNIDVLKTSSTESHIVCFALDN